VTPLYTVLALTAFAANSLLCRLALGGATIDAASFTSVRLVSGAITLFAISGMLPADDRATVGGARGRAGDASRPGWRSAVALFSYAIAFSVAYVSLTTGTGALILFGAVQTTMITRAIGSGERPHLLEWVGLASALTGLVVLVFPGLSAPPLLGSLVMAVAGISWGFYTLWGRGTGDPLAATATNFARSVPFTLVVSLVAIGSFHASARGVLLAVTSGAIASGLGYVVWYAAIRGLTATRAAIVQSATPVLTAIGGVIVLSERISIRLVAAAVLILGGIGLATAGRR
jgi:drug/metabolite transporter (DMT)-like permease